LFNKQLKNNIIDLQKFINILYNNVSSDLFIKKRVKIDKSKVNVGTLDENFLNHHKTIYEFRHQQIEYNFIDDDEEFNNYDNPLDYIG